MSATSSRAVDPARKRAYLAIRIALESIPPLLMTGIRWVSAGAVAR